MQAWQRLGGAGSRVGPAGAGQPPEGDTPYHRHLVSSYIRVPASVAGQSCARAMGHV